MKPSAKPKCLHCKEFYVPDRRNLHHQRYCGKPDCQRESKRQSQCRWLAKSGNENYFRGAGKFPAGRRVARGASGVFAQKGSPPQKSRYKMSAPLKRLSQRRLRRRRVLMRYKMSSPCKWLWLWGLSPR